MHYHVDLVVKQSQIIHLFIEFRYTKMKMSQSHRCISDNRQHAKPNNYAHRDCILNCLSVHFEMRPKEENELRALRVIGMNVEESKMHFWLLNERVVSQIMYTQRKSSHSVVKFSKYDFIHPRFEILI